MTTGRIFVLIGAALLILGALLPWGEINTGLFSRSVAGISGDGIFTALSGVALLIIGISRKGQPNTNYSWAAFILALVPGIFLCNKIYSLAQLTLTNQLISIGSGLWISIFGTLLGIMGGIWTVKVEEKTT